MTSPGYRWPDDITVPCPSEAAYKRHIRHGEEPCAGDYAAARLAASERQARHARKVRGGKIREAVIGEAMRELLDLIAAECRRAGYLPAAGKRGAA